MINPYQQYKEQSLATLAPGEVLVKLFDECIKQLLIAKRNMESKDYYQVNQSLTKVQTILSTLDSSLDMHYPVSEGLRNLYRFMIQHILQANIKKNTKAIDECVVLIKDLRESFSQAEKSTRRESAVGGQAV